MIAGAVAAYLTAHGLAPVRLSILGDYVPGAGPVWAVHDEAGADLPRLELVEQIYSARLQIRARDDDMLRAVTACRRAFDLVQRASGKVLGWTDPTGGPARLYKIEHVRVTTRPTWFPTPPPSGETASCNFELRIREVE